MNKYQGIPELLEGWMLEQGMEERWVTVQELRERFGLSRYQCNTLSGFLRRLEHGPFGQFPYIVANITREDRELPSDPKRCRYLLKHRDPQAVVRRYSRDPGTAHGT
ncbi:hypothetical protein [Methanoregula sp. PtaB.Bin085]|uniref:hypothetical protein n=1 Tax=Methanoregula sp. PtaB.Bin085 TaxID=1811680 RepID=UPI0025ECE547|nr:hypothetical protein [Methanoregula sp. PtaB.Bin085]